MNFLYNILVWKASILGSIVARFSQKTALFFKGQKEIDRHLVAITSWKSSGQPIIWFHCASLGEFEQGRPVLEAFKKEHPAFGVLLTFFSPSGYEVRKNYPLADFVTYLPIDTPSKVRNFVQTVKPEIVVVVKYEFWPNLISEIKKSGARLIGISVILRESQIFFKPYGKAFLKVLQAFDFLFLQNDDSARLLNQVGLRNHEVVGDTRFDSVLNTAKKAQAVAGIEEFKGNKPLMVVGSAWPEDMQVVLPFIKNHPEIKFIIAPHEIKETQIKEWTIASHAARYSEGLDQKAQQKNVLIIDSIGLLSKLYRYADYAFVGGGFRTGLHNILEPVVFGIPVFFGNKKYKKFQEAIDLLAIGVAFAVNNSIDECFMTVDKEKIRIAANEYVNKNAGATQKIIKYLDEQIAHNS